MKENNEFVVLTKVLSSVRLFDDMRREEILTLLNLMTKATYQAGHYIFREEDMGATLYVLASGTVEVQKKGAQNKIVTLATLQAGDTFGEVALVRDHVRKASVLALEQCLVLAMETKSIWGFPQIAAKLYLNISRVLADRLVIANEMLFDAKTKRV